MLRVARSAATRASARLAARDAAAAPAPGVPALLLRLPCAAQPQADGGAFALTSQCSRRAFGTKRVTQRRRSQGRTIQLKQTHYEPKPDGYRPLPLSLLANGYLRRVLNTRTQEAQDLAGRVDWERYKSDVTGVRWHPVGGWRVQFDRRDYEHNFFVRCDCYFRVTLYGFDRAKELAIAYRKRLEAEWEEQQRIWRKLDAQREAKRLQRRAERLRALEYAEADDDAAGFWGGGDDALGVGSGESGEFSGDVIEALPGLGGSTRPL